MIIFDKNNVLSCVYQKKVVILHRKMCEQKNKFNKQ